MLSGDSALFCWLVLSAIWTNGPKAVTSRRLAYVSGSPVLLLWKLLRNKIPQISDKSVQAPRDSFQSIAEWKLDKTFLYYFLCMTVERVLKLLVQISYLFFFQESELQGFECYVKRSLWSGGNLTRRRDIFQNQVVCDFLICCLFVDAEQASCHQLSFCFRIYVSVVQQSFYPFNSLLPRGD